MTNDMTDEEFAAKFAAAKKRITFTGDDGASAVPIAAETLPPWVGVAPSGQGDTVEAEWSPECVRCTKPMGYRAKFRTYGAQTECAACAQGSSESRLKASGISHREIAEPLSSLVSSGPEFDRWLAFCRRFAALKPAERIDPPFAFVCGNNGVGKSAGAQRALRDAILAGCSGRFVRFSELISKIYSTYGRKWDEVDERTADVILLYSSVHLLVIDEVGLETPSDHAMGLFFDFVDDRWKSCLPTIFTSNYALAENALGAHITERAADETRMRGILDRLRGGTGDQVFVLKGKSWRGREAHS